MIEGTYPIEYDEFGGGRDPAKQLEEETSRLSKLGGTEETPDTLEGKKLGSVSRRISKYLQESRSSFKRPVTTETLHNTLGLPFTLIWSAVQYSESTGGDLFFSRRPDGRVFYTMEGYQEGYAIIDSRGKNYTGTLNNFLAAVKQKAS